MAENGTFFMAIVSTSFKIRVFPSLRKCMFLDECQPMCYFCNNGQNLFSRTHLKAQSKVKSVNLFNYKII